ncbi:MAG: hypothetical protein D3912_11840, partial [Candidatus Electrothrix sp. AX1]|nr:hypothetical protein [Candidatus Electrothrix sp. AX1]
MISPKKYVRAAAFCGLIGLVASGLLFQKMPSNAVAQEDAAQEDAAQEEPTVEQEAPADATPSTSAAAVECYESIKGATELV